MQKTILIVDFEQESSEELQQILQSENFLVLKAADGQQALAVFEAAKPDLVLTEALLPKLNGFELCKKITSAELRDVRPVIMYSAIYKGEKYQKEAVSGCGAAEFLDKPIPKWQLLKAVRAALSELPQGKPAAASPAKKADPVPPAELHQANPAFGSGDPLGVDGLFDGPATPPVSEPIVASAPDTVVLETPFVESKAALMPSIESKEIDDALDAVRVDLYQETQKRDELLAQQFEQELHESGQSILEFEAAITSTQQAPSPGEQVGNRELELDEVLPHFASEAQADFAEATAQSTAAAAPNFAIKPASSRNWLPILIMLLLALLAGAYFWFRG
jgi:CheY-like chemotaxis protein